MPLIPLVAVLLLVVALILTMPLTLFLRYRASTVRRLGRRWVSTLNLVMLVFSAALFLTVAAITSFWVSGAFRYSVFGFMGGCLLGLLGVALTRWEETPRALYYTPNRWLILIITLAVTARLLYGVWRIWHGWRTSGSDTSWLEAAGIAGSLAIGAVVLGYYVTYLAGVRWRLRRRDKT
ncbi:MAG: hypothetical protein WCC08_03775 [Terrimicrobiaceae bacterium]